MLKKKVVSVVLVGVLGLGATGGAEAGSLFTMRRACGVVSLAGSGFFFKEAQDYHDKADAIYDEYEQADSQEEAERLYDKTSRYDRRSEVHLLVGSLLALNGLRLLFMGEGGTWDKVERISEDLSIQTGSVALRLQGDPRLQEVRMSIDRSF